MLDVSVVIVSFNTVDLLADCLTSLYGKPGNVPSPENLTAIPAEVFVVDNGSTDGSQDMMRRQFPQVKLIDNGRNLGFAAANNQAIRLASGRYLLLLNPDTVVLGDAIARLAGFLEANPGVAVAGAQLEYPDGSHQHSAFRFPGLLTALFDFFPINHRLFNSRFNARYPVSHDGQPFAIDHPLGACMMVRREAIADAGELDEQYFMYCEEIDWCLRMKKRGWRLYCLPEARVIHYGGQSTKQIKGAMYVELYRSRARFYRKHYSPQFRLAARLLVKLGLWNERRKARQKFGAGLIGPDQLEKELKAIEGAGRVMSEYA